VLHLTHEGVVPVLADIRQFLIAVAAALPEQARGPGAWAVTVTEQVREQRERYERSWSSADLCRMHPGHVVDVLAGSDDATAVLFADVGYMAAWTGAHYPVPRSGRHYHRANGPLGWSIPAGIGAALAEPAARVVVVIDGGAVYNVAEIETVVRCGARLLVVVVNNRSFALERHIELQARGQVLGEVNDFEDIDFAGVARSLDARGHTVADVGSLGSAVHDFDENGGVLVLDVKTDMHTVRPVSSLRTLTEFADQRQPVIAAGRA
jgi:thiamine pyrophosphate-dependent acetolactate synthase large subunit-like protein